MSTRRPPSSAAPRSWSPTNTEGFPLNALRRHGVTVKRPDPYLTEVLDAFPDDLVAVVREMAADKLNPPMTVTEVLAALHGAGAGSFVKAIRASLKE